MDAASGADGIRAVFYLDISAHDVDAALTAVGDVLTTDELMAADTGSVGLH